MPIGQYIYPIDANGKFKMKYRILGARLVGRLSVCGREHMRGKTPPTTNNVLT